MKKNIIIILLLLFVGTAEKSLAAKGDVFLLPKLGFMKVDLTNADDLASLGFLLGVGLSKNFSFEGEINASLNVFSSGIDNLNGNYEIVEDGVLKNKGQYEIWTVAGYGVFRYPVTNIFYLKGKLGVLFENVKRTDEIDDGETKSDAGLAGGLGMGFYLGGKVTLELEATLIDKDITFYSLGFHLQL